tara:strand:+ start:1112 stop:1423 length:312 start_codon:yes stop_codon:yes gene_type:complete
MDKKTTLSRALYNKLYYKKNATKLKKQRLLKLKKLKPDELLKLKQEKHNYYLNKITLFKKRNQKRYKIQKKKLERLHELEKLIKNNVKKEEKEIDCSDSPFDD